MNSEEEFQKWKHKMDSSPDSRDYKMFDNIDGDGDEKKAHFPYFEIKRAFMEGLEWRRK